jgi:signal transduction histidine kinase
MESAAKRSYPWYNSLLVRVVSLCALLMLFLLCSLFVIGRFYFHQLRTHITERNADMVGEVQRKIKESEKIGLLLEQGPLSQNGVPLPGDRPTDSDGATTNELEDLMQTWEKRYGVKLDLHLIDAVHESTITPRIGDSTQFETTQTFTSGGKTYELVALFEINPQTELVIAYRNKYLVALLLGFVATLGAMIYFILKALRPLSELADSCTQISTGALHTVEVKKNYGEILALEQTFNKMVTSLQDKERMETNLRQAQRLSALGNLAAGVAHDLRNPLNALKLLSSHALDTLQTSEDPAAAAKQIATIRSEVDRLEDIVSGFLSLAKERELLFAQELVDALLEECLGLVRKDAELRDIRLASELRAGSTVLMLDAKHFKRAIINVIINAMEACRKGGRVRVFSRLTEKECEIEIRDDGAGMQKDVIERAFEPYYTTKHTGTGLGLAITRGIIEEHGGKIELSSTPGEGTQVLIRLPLEQN